MKNQLKKSRKYKKLMEKGRISISTDATKKLRIWKRSKKANKDLIIIKNAPET